MRRSRRGGGSSSEFGSSGEDSFVAVVVTKLTGALLFILLLTMVIMALLPKAVDQDLAEKSQSQAADGKDGQPLKIATPTRLPEAIAGRSYLVALAATGGRGPLHWSVEGTVPEWLSLDADNGQLAGTPPTRPPSRSMLAIGVSDGAETASQIAQLSILPFQAPSSTAAWLKRQLRCGRLAGMAGARHRVSGALVGPLAGDEPPGQSRSADRSKKVCWLKELGSTEVSVQKRFATYRLLVRLTTLSAMVGMAIWLYLAARRRH